MKVIKMKIPKFLLLTFTILATSIPIELVAPPKKNKKKTTQHRQARRAAEAAARKAAEAAATAAATIAATASKSTAPAPAPAPVTPAAPQSSAPVASAATPTALQPKDQKDAARATAALNAWEIECPASAAASTAVISKSRTPAAMPQPTATATGSATKVAAIVNTASSDHIILPPAAHQTTSPPVVAQTIAVRAAGSQGEYTVVSRAATQAPSAATAPVSTAALQPAQYTATATNLFTREMDDRGSESLTITDSELSAIASFAAHNVFKRPVND